MSERVRIGLLGCGRIGSMHADLVARRVPGTALAAVYDVAADMAISVAETFGARRASSATELIEADEVDAVAICSSTDTHMDLLVEVAAAGKPAFVEKPLSLDLAEVDRGIGAATEAGIAVQVGFNRRFDAAHRHVRDRVAAGDVGDVHLVRISSRDPDPPPIAYIEVSGGIFCDMTIHDFDMARFVTGSEAVEVYATGAVRVDPAIGAAGDLDTVVVVVTHDNGAITTIDNSRRAVYGYDQRVEAFGSGGMATSQNPARGNRALLGAGRVPRAAAAVLLPGALHRVVSGRVGRLRCHGERRAVAGEFGRRARPAGDGSGRVGFGPRGPPGGHLRDRLREMRPACSRPSESAVCCTVCEQNAASSVRTG